MRFVKIFIVVFVVAFLVIFCVQNKEALLETYSITFQVPFIMQQPMIATESPLLFTVVGAFLIGALMVWFYLLMGNIRSGSLARKNAHLVEKLHKDNDAQTEEIEALKTRLDELVAGPTYSAEPVAEAAEDEEEKEAQKA